MLQLQLEEQYRAEWEEHKRYEDLKEIQAEKKWGNHNTCG